MNNLSKENLLNILSSLQLVGYAQTNEKGEILDISLNNNYKDQKKVIPLFRFSNKVLPNITVLEN